MAERERTPFEHFEQVTARHAVFARPDQRPSRPCHLDRLLPQNFAHLLPPPSVLPQIWVRVEIRGRERVVGRDRAAGGEEGGMGRQAGGESERDPGENLDGDPLVSRCLNTGVQGNAGLASV